MRAIRESTIIDPSTFSFEGVQELKGNKAEVIFLIEDTNQPDSKPTYNAAGALSDYADVDKVADEKLAWEKHGEDFLENVIN